MSARPAPDRNFTASAVTYLSVRASLFTGLFRSHRIELREDFSVMPSYMRLQTKTHSLDFKSYLEALLPRLEEQMPTVLENHLLSDHRLDEWFQFLKARTAARDSE
jgi:hypothetical protein